MYIDTDTARLALTALTRDAEAARIPSDWRGRAADAATGALTAWQARARDATQEGVAFTYHADQLLAKAAASGV